MLQYTKRTMSFNKGYELKKFEAHWEKLRIEYAAAGMTEDAIQKMYDYDRQQFNSERTCIERTQHDAAERGTATVFRDRLPLDVDADDGGTGQLRQPVLHFFPERDIQNVFYGVFKPAHTFDFPSPCRIFEHCHHK